MYAIGRLAPGATVERAVAELSTIMRREELKNGMGNTSIAVVATPLMTHLLGPARPALLAIAAAAGALLLIACANAAWLLLIHGTVSQAPNQVQHFMVRLSGDPLATVAALRSAVATIDPDARARGACEGRLNRCCSVSLRMIRRRSAAWACCSPPCRLWRLICPLDARPASIPPQPCGLSSAASVMHRQQLGRSGGEERCEGLLSHHSCC